MEKIYSQAIDFSQLPNWQNDDHAAAFRAFYRSARLYTDRASPQTGTLGVDGRNLLCIMQKALTSPHLCSERVGAQNFFETNFVPHDFQFKVSCSSDWPGFLTGYYEPEIAGALSADAQYYVPILKRPPDLIELTNLTAPPNWPQNLQFARKTEKELQPYFDRTEIEGSCFHDGVLADRGLELVWLDDRIEAFFTHIQGSARVQLKEGGLLRIGYDGKSGHPYTAIGRILKQEGALSAEPITMQTIKAWLRSHASEQRRILQHNQSYIFFKENKNLDPKLGPCAAAGVQLTPGRSLAVDNILHTFHTPIFVQTIIANNPPIARLMIAQDTGSAIVGPHRGDYFFGSGEKAALFAGHLATAAKFIIFIPKI